MKQIFFITSNKNKLKEVQMILKDYEVIQVDVDLIEIQGTCDEIIKQKGIEAKQHITKDRIIVEDTSLCFNSLNGLPGPYIKSFIKQIGLLNCYKLLSDFTDKSAYALTSICYINKEKIQIIKGITNGVICLPKSKGNTFGWDPIFKPEGFEETYDEMTIKQKNEISHRSKAFTEFIKILEEEGEDD